MLALAVFGKQVVSSAGVARIAVLADSVESAMEFVKVWHDDGIETSILPADDGLSMKAFAEGLANDNIEVLVYLGQPERLSDFLDAAATLHYWPTVLIPGVHMRAELLDVDPGFDNKIFLAMPALPMDYRSAALQRYQRLQSRYQLPGSYRNVQLQVIAASALLEEGSRPPAPENPDGFN